MLRSNPLIFCFLISLLSFPQWAIGQKEGNSWCFGTHAYLNFNEDYPQPLPLTSNLNSMEGVSSISGPDGKLLLYTDGKTLWSGTNQVLSDNLSGSNRATQSSLILRKPGTGNLFYIFTIDSVGPVNRRGNGLCYSIFNTDANQFEPGSLNKSLMNGWVEGCTEKIVAIRHANGNDFWIIAHEFNLSVFKKFLLTQNGLNVLPDQILGLKHPIDNTNSQGARGYLKASPNGDFIALAIEGIKNYEVFRFNDQTGVISDPLLIDGNQNEQDFGAFGVEFSPTGRYLYGTNRQNGIIYRYSLKSYNPTIVKESRQIIRSAGAIKCGALQMAPDGKIYVALNGKSYLGLINAPDMEDCGFREQGASLVDPGNDAGGICGFGLPNFPAGYFRQEIYYAYTCAGETTRFYLANRDIVDNPPTWTIEGNPIQTDPDTYDGIYENSIGGTVSVTMEGSKAGQRVSRTRQVKIHPLPNPAIEDITYMCSPPLLLIDAIWAFWSLSDGNVTDTNRYVTEYKKYAVSVTNYQGCTTAADTEVVPGLQPEIDAILVDSASCYLNSDGRIEILMKGNLTDYTFKWSDSDDNTNIRENLLAGDYSVTIASKNAPLCKRDTTIPVGAKSVNLKMERIPDGNSPVCPGTLVILQVSGAISYSWDNPAGKTTDTVHVYPMQDQVYKVRGTTGATCPSTGEIKVLVHPDKLDLGGDRTTCAGETILIKGKDLPYSDYQTWLWSPGGSTEDFVEIKESGVITLTVTDINSCTWSDTIEAFFNPLPVFSLTSNPVSCAGRTDGKITVTVVGDPGNYLYSIDGETWSTNSVFTNLGIGSYNITVQEKLTECISPQQVIEVKDPLPVADFTAVADSASCNGSNDGKITVVMEDITSGFSYSIAGDAWSTDKVFTGLQAGVYSVKIRNGNNCPGPEKQVEIGEPAPINFGFRARKPMCSDCSDGEITIHDITGGSPPYSFEWEGNVITDTIFVISDLSAGTYEFTVKDRKECSFSQEFTLEAGTFFVPNAFSPNEGGTVNQTWVIEVLEGWNNCLVQVFDRSGKLVFLSDGPYDNPWDGTYLKQGRVLPAGTYFYLIQLDKSDPAKPIQRGTVTIVR